MWIIVLFWLWGGRGFGNGFGGNGNDCCANGLPAQLNNDYGRELLMQAIQGNRSAIDQISNALNCSTSQLQNAICNVQGAIDKVAGQVGMTSQAVINAVQQQGCEIGNQISSCCCNLSSLINQSTCATQNMITKQGFDNQLRTLEQTNVLQSNINQGLANNREQATTQFNILSAKIDAQSQQIQNAFCDLEKREMQHTIDSLREQKQTLELFSAQQAQTQSIVNQIRPCPVPAFLTCNPFAGNGYGGYPYGFNGYNRDMFRDLKKGFQVYTLDTSDVPVFRMGNVVNVSEPRFQQPQMGQMGQYQQLQDRVIDLTVEINGSSMTYVVPEGRDVAMSNNITLACSVDPIMNQLNAAKRTSSDILDSIDKHRRTLEACDSILEEINPAFKQTKDQDRKIKNLEEKVDRMGSSFDELKELLIKKLG